MGLLSELIELSLYFLGIKKQQEKQQEIDRQRCRERNSKIKTNRQKETVRDIQTKTNRQRETVRYRQKYIEIEGSSKRQTDKDKVTVGEKTKR